ncbi:MAG TPA: heme o synthase [Candidatus Saccharimonadales bacterium]
MEKIKAYYRLTKPGIIYGNGMMALAGFLFASGGKIQIPLMFALLVGIGLVIASACALNNYIDRGIDSKMARTKKRAIPTGVISGKSAIIFAVVLGVIGFGLLIVFTNWATVLLGAIAYFTYIVLYGYTKRTSVYSTLVGSISGAVPPAAGYVAVTGSFDMAALLLFLIMTFWQMPHFYAIGMYRRKDYASADLPILPVKKGMQATKVQILAYIPAFVAAACLLTLYGYASIVFLVGMTLLGGIWFYKGVQGFKAKDDEKWARMMFFFSLKVLLGFAFLLSIDWLIA